MLNIVIFNIVNAVFELLRWVLIAYIILGWIRTLNSTLWQISEALDHLVNPILQPFRKVVPVIDLGGMSLDLTPIVVYILLGIVQAAVLPIILAIPV